MTITISLKAFKAGTTHPVWSRAESKVWGIDWSLERYLHMLEHNPDALDLTLALEGIIEDIEKWGQGKATRVVNGERRYRDWRDRKGLISRLEREARSTLQEVRHVANLMARGMVGRRQSAPPVRASTHRSLAISALSDYEPDLIGDLLNEPTTRSGLPASTPLRRGSIAAAARLLALARLPAKVQGKETVPGMAELAEAIAQATGMPAHSLKVSVQFEQIALGLDKLGYHVDHVRRTDLAGLLAALSKASRSQPVLLCVGDRTPRHAWNGPGGRAHGPEAQAVHAVVCTGRQGSGEGFAVEDFHCKVTNGVLFDDGDYFSDEGQDWLTAEPSLGYIQVRRLGS